MTETPADPATEAGSPSFSALGLPDSILASLKSLGYKEPTPIQTEAIPPLLAGRDLLGQASTGTGKTAAFALPALVRVDAQETSGAPSVLILVPTRELAVQVQKAIHEYARGSGASVLAVFGGQPIGRQLGPLKRGVDIVVATPGRALDHIRRKSLRTDQLQILVLDEADEMLDMGFAEELEAILEGTPESRQTMLFSATMPARIAKIARQHMNDPVRIEISREAVAHGESPGSARPPTSCRAITRQPRLAGCLTWNGRNQRSSSAGPATKSTSWRSHSAVAATGPTRCMAAWTSSSATA